MALPISLPRDETNLDTKIGFDSPRLSLTYYNYKDGWTAFRQDVAGIQIDVPEKRIKWIEYYFGKFILALPRSSDPRALSLLVVKGD